MSFSLDFEVGKTKEEHVEALNDIFSSWTGLPEAHVKLASLTFGTSTDEESDAFSPSHASAVADDAKLAQAVEAVLGRAGGVGSKEHRRQMMSAVEPDVSIRTTELQVEACKQMRQGIGLCGSSCAVHLC